jgi:chorismate synthase
MLRWLTAGESHGPALTAILEGMPAGVPLTTEAIDRDLSRRRLGVGRGARQNFEADKVTIQGGVRHGLTMGGPIAVVVGNSEWPKWETVMAADPVAKAILDGQARNAPLTRPRPGHADLAGMQKFSFDDARPILERASARETAARVALGAAARSFLESLNSISVFSHVVSIGGVSLDQYELPQPGTARRIDDDPVRCLDPAVSAKMQEEIAAAHKDGDTLGGVVEVLVYGLPPGLGSFSQWDRRLDSRLAAALMSIQAIKGVELGDGFSSATRRGSQAHDEMDLVGDGQVRRRTHRSGGTEGGISTGEVLRVRAAMKPISTVPRALDTIDTSTGEAAKAINQRSDVCAVPAAGIVAEAMVALVIADAMLEKFGGDHLDETRRNLDGYLANLKIR